MGKDELVRPEVNQIKEYVPGKNPARPGMIKLASNENPFGPSPLALKAIAEEAPSLHTYPDQKSSLLREAIAKKTGLPADCVICGNGSDDIMQIIAATYLNPGEEVLIPKNTFSVYELVSVIFGGQARFAELKDCAVDLSSLANAVTPRTKLIFIANPNNPTGTAFSPVELDCFLKKIPEEVLVVIDQAYGEFAYAKDFPDCIDHIKAGRNLLALRTFSKLYGLAGLRIGYGLGKKELLAPMFRTKMPFNVSRLAQAGAVAALNDQAHVVRTLKNNDEEKKYLYAEFDRLGLDYKKTEANFIFINARRSADELFLALLGQEVIIRPLTSFGFPEAIRVSIGTRPQNEKLIAALKKVWS
jgi:histidinol-phosphate aminotransferase